MFREKGMGYYLSFVKWWVKLWGLKGHRSKHGDHYEWHLPMFVVFEQLLMATSKLQQLKWYSDAPIHHHVMYEIYPMVGWSAHFTWFFCDKDSTISMSQIFFFLNVMSRRLRWVHDQASSLSIGSAKVDFGKCFLSLVPWLPLVGSAVGMVVTPSEKN